SGAPNRQPKKPKKRAPTRVDSHFAASVRVASPERTRAESPLRPAPVRTRATAAPIVDYHYVIQDLKHVGFIALGMFVVLGVLAVFLH
ncbi:MAG: hypothetical protein Q8P59_13245, partial [Dehalococcoidia bacterium]|nr:hypothetical protein [Dehalococcoidia bacterium]